jgi:glycosyltransferase involved in cell wall biosynthesis
MRLLFIFRLYSGFTTSIAHGRWEPFGLPAVYKLLEAVAARGIPARVVFLAREELEMDFVERVAFPGIDIDFLIIPAYRLPAWLNVLIRPKRLHQRIARLYNDMRQFYRTLKLAGEPADAELVYVDRRNIVLAALFKLRGWRTVVRFHGVFDWNRHRYTLSMLICQPLYYFALKSSFDLVLSSEDGSPAQPFFERYLARHTPYRVLVNGVDMDQPIDRAATPIRVQYGFTEPWPVLLYVSRLTEDKGAREFIDALIAVNRRCPRFYVVIVAGGSDTAWARAALEQAGLGERVAFERSLPHSDILAYFHQADVFVSPNKFANLTNTVLEALAAGICVVMLGKDPITHADESTEALIPGDVVVRVPRFSGVPGLTDALALLVEDIARIEAYRDCTKAFAKNFLYSWDKRTDDEIELLQCVASGGRTDSADQRATAVRGVI